MASTAASFRSRSASSPGLRGQDGVRQSQRLLSAPLEEFSGRLWGFVRTCLGLHHPHEDRLKAALDHQVEALGNGFGAVLSMRTAFFAFRSSAREAGLWRKLREYRQRLFQCNVELREAKATASKEASLRRAMADAMSLSQHQAKAARCKAVAMLCGGPAASEVLLMSCLSSWRRVASMDATARTSAMKAFAMAFSATQSGKMRPCFLAWKVEAKSAAEQRITEEAHEDWSVEAQLLLSRAKAATASVVMAAGSKAERQLLASNFTAWWRYTMKAKCQDLRVRAEQAELMATKRADTVQKMSTSRFYDPNCRRLCQVTLLRWGREASCSARRWQVREAAAKAATLSAQLLRQQRCQGLLCSCLGGWAGATPGIRPEVRLGWSYASCGSKEVPVPSSRAAPLMRGTAPSISKSSALQTEPASSKTEASEKNEMPGQAWLWQQQQLHPSMPWAEKKPRPRSAGGFRTEAKKQVEATSVPDVAECDKSMQEAVKHLCLASQASVSEEGYKELLEYHRQKARQDRSARR